MYLTSIKIMQIFIFYIFALPIFLIRPSYLDYVDLQLFPHKNVLKISP